MKSGIVLFTVLLLLIYVPQTANSAGNYKGIKVLNPKGMKIEPQKFYKAIKIKEEPGDTRTFDCYFHAKDSDYWYREANAFFTNMWFHSWWPLDPHYSPVYERRYLCMAQQPYFMEDNNEVVDSTDLIYFVGHGNHFKIGMTSGSDYLWLPDVPGLGDRDLEFIIFQACSVIPAPPDEEHWAAPWMEHDGKGIFQGLHSACGFRTTEWAGDEITAQILSSQLTSNVPVIQSWFLTNWMVRTIRGAAAYPSLASALYYPGLENDTLYTYGADPPHKAHWLSICWEETI